MATLTDKQKQAVEAAGNVAIIAGAGTGKTTTLAERYKFLVEKQGLSPLNIVAVTFTEKAAAELRSRIRRLLRDCGSPDRLAELESAEIGTIHSLAARICRDFALYIGIPADFTIADEKQAAIINSIDYFNALSELNPEFVDELGFSFLKRTLKVMLDNQAEVVSALKISKKDIAKNLQNDKRKKFEELLNSNIWKNTKDILYKHSASDDEDKLEIVRQEAIRLIETVETTRSLPTDIKNNSIFNFSKNLGSGKNWGDALPKVRETLSAFKEALKNYYSLYSLELNRSDDEMFRRLELLKHVYEKMKEILADERKQRRVLSFDDLEIYASRILENNEAVEHYAKRWKAILVDEYQDTSPIQAKIIHRLAESAKLTVVGDYKQSIFGFRGADPEVFEQARKLINNDVELTESFRSHSEIVNSVNEICSNLLGSLHSPLHSSRQPLANQPSVIVAAVEKDTEEDKKLLEAQWVANEIIRLIEGDFEIYDRLHGKNRPVEFGDIAILAHNWSSLEKLEPVLENAGIPSINAGGGNLLECREALDGIMLFSFLANPSDDIALASLLRSPFFAVSDEELYSLSKSREEGETLFDALKRNQNEFKNISETVGLLINQSRTKTAYETLRFADQVCGYSAVITNLSSGKRIRADWLGFLELVATFETIGISDVIGTSSYLDQLLSAEVQIARPTIEATDAVSLISIHSAKGLEWPVVFLYGTNGQFRSSDSQVKFDSKNGFAFKWKELDETNSQPASYEFINGKIIEKLIAERRRLIYVALTRAADRLYITSDCQEPKSTAVSVTSPAWRLIYPCLNSLESNPNFRLEIITKGSIENLRKQKRQPATAAQVVEDALLEPIANDIKELPVTSLDDYAICPKRFKLNFIDGHPGSLQKEFSRAGRIGRLVHKALELDIDSIEKLKIFAAASSDDEINEAFNLVEAFRNEQVFSEIAKLEGKRELPVFTECCGIRFSGIADFVTDDFVLDYKTDSVLEKSAHRFQLWAYSKSLSLKTAKIAYLRHKEVITLGQQNLEEIEKEAFQLIEKIKAGDFKANPRKEVCSYCRYKTICKEALTE